MFPYKPWVASACSIQFITGCASIPQIDSSGHSLQEAIGRPTTSNTWPDEKRMNARIIQFAPFIKCARLARSKRSRAPSTLRGCVWALSNALCLGGYVNHFAVAGDALWVTPCGILSFMIHAGIAANLCFASHGLARGFTFSAFVCDSRKGGPTT